MFFYHDRLDRGNIHGGWGCVYGARRIGETSVLWGVGTVFEGCCRKRGESSAKRLKNQLLARGCSGEGLRRMGVTSLNLQSCCVLRLCGVRDCSAHLRCIKVAAQIENSESFLSQFCIHVCSCSFSAKVESHEVS